MARDDPSENPLSIESVNGAATPAGKSNDQVFSFGAPVVRISSTGPKIVVVGLPTW